MRWQAFWFFLRPSLPFSAVFELKEASIDYIFWLLSYQEVFDGSKDIFKVIENRESDLTFYVP